MVQTCRKLWFPQLQFMSRRLHARCCARQVWRLFRAVYTGTRPWLTPAIRAAKVAGTPGACSQVFCHQLAARRNEPGQTRRFLNHLNHHHHFRSHFGSRPNQVCDRAVFLFPTCSCEKMAETSVRPSAGGVARRRRERRLRSWWRHEQPTVRMALAAATHHSAQQNAASRKPKTSARAREVEEQVTHDGLRAQTAPPPGARPGMPQRSDRSLRHPSGGAPSLALVSLAGGDAPDAAAVAFLLSAALTKKKEERGGGEAADEGLARTAHGRPRSSSIPAVACSLLLFVRLALCSLLSSPGPDALHHGWYAPGRQLCCEIVVDIPFVPQTQILMVQTIQQTIEFPQLLYVSGGRCPCCAGRSCHAVLVLTTAVCAHGWLCWLRCASAVFLLIFGKMAGIFQKDSCCGMYKTGYAGCAAPRAGFSSSVRRPMMLGIMAGMDQNDSCCSMYKAGYAGCNALRAVSFSLVRRPMMLGIMPVWTGRTVAVACIRLVMLVAMHLALCSFPSFAGP